MSWYRRQGPSNSRASADDLRRHGDPRTLADDDIKGSSRKFEEFLTSSGLEIRT